MERLDKVRRYRYDLQVQFLDKGRTSFATRKSPILLAFRSNLYFHCDGSRRVERRRAFMCKSHDDVRDEFELAAPSLHPKTPSRLHKIKDRFEVLFAAHVAPKRANKVRMFTTTR